MSDETALPWWKRGTFAILISAAIPVATLAQGWMQKNRELALQEHQQLQQFRAQYMAVLAEAGVEGIEVLADFIADTEQDPSIRDWARKQREKAQAKLAELDKEAAAEEMKANLAQAQAQAARDKMEKKKRAEVRAENVGRAAGGDSPPPREPRETTAHEVEAARRELATAQTAATMSEVKAARVRTALGGRNFSGRETSAVVRPMISPPVPIQPRP